MAGEENIGGISASIAVDADGVVPGLAQVESALNGVNDRLRDSQGRFLAAGDAALAMASKSKEAAESLAGAFASATAGADASVAAIAKASSYASAWSAVTAQANANVARVREAEKGMTVMPVGQLQFAGLRVQDQWRREDAAEAERAKKRKAYVDDVKKGDEARDRAEPGWRNKQGLFGSGGGGGFNLAVIGQTLDDMQYVGEMGLRPIINNLMQINPLLGLTALGFDQLRKNGDWLTDTLKSVAEYIGLATQQIGSGEADTRDFDQRKFELGTKGMSVETLLSEGFTWYEMIKEELGVASGQTRRSEEAAIAKFTGKGGKEDKDAGKKVAEAIGNFGTAEFLAALTDPNLEGDTARKDKLGLIGLAERAAKGDPEAIAELRERTSGIPGLGRDIRDAVNARGDKAESDRLVAEGNRGAAEYDAKVRARDAADKAESDRLVAEGNRGAAEYDAKVKADEKAEKLRDEVLNASEKQANDRARLMEKGSDLDWNLFKLMNPDREVKTLSGDQYAASQHGSTGISEEAKRLHAIYEVEKQIAENTRNLRNIGQPRVNRR